jgi:serine/threonine protein kinase
MINQVLDNRYRIVRVLGSGTSGLIYLAADIHHPDFPVCVIRQLKLPKKNSLAFTRLRFLIERKSDVLERLTQNHPSSEILDYFVEDQKFYLVEEYVPGHPLNSQTESSSLQSEDQGVLRLQEMFKMLGSTNTPTQRQSPIPASPPEPPDTEIDSVQPPPPPPPPHPEKPRFRKLLWLLLAGGAV